MASKSVLGNGTKLEIGDGASPEVFTKVAQLKTWQFSGQSANYDDITNADSPALVAGGPPVQEQVPSQIKAGTMTCSGVYSPTDAGFQALDTAFKNQELTNFKLTLRNGTVFAFAAYVSDQPLPDVDYSKAATIKITLTLSSVVTVTPAA